MPENHPTILSPATRLPPTEYSSHSRSQSRSPTRNQRSSTHEFDPLLSNLSPTSTLEALSTTDAASSRGGKDLNALQESIADASSSERSLGVRAALAAKKLREWHAEIAAWQWPNAATEQKNGFEVPRAEELAKALSHAERGAHFTDTQDLREEEEIMEEHWGSLPRRVIEEYEERIELIMEGMEALDVEELKSHVLEAHVLSGSRPMSASVERDVSVPLANYNHLHGFTAVVTATILRALPYLSRLNMLLTTWSVRLIVLRQVPGFFRTLEGATTAIKSGWDSIPAASTSVPSHGTGISREAFNIMQRILEDRVTAAGQRLDRMLDALEGREDTIPKQWVDDMEMVEADYSDWVVEAENNVLENEWQHYQEHAEPQGQPVPCGEQAQDPVTLSLLSSAHDNSCPTGPSRYDRDAFANHGQGLGKFRETSDHPEPHDVVAPPSMPNTKPPVRNLPTLLSDETGSFDYGGASQNSATTPLPSAKSVSPSEDTLLKGVADEPAPAASHSLPSTLTTDSKKKSTTEVPSMSTIGDGAQDSELENRWAADKPQYRNHLIDSVRQGREPSVQVDGTDRKKPTDLRTKTAPMGLRSLESQADTLNWLSQDSIPIASERIRHDTPQTDQTPDKANGMTDSEEVLVRAVSKPPCEDASWGSLASKSNDIALPESNPSPVRTKEGYNGLLSSKAPSFSSSETSSALCPSAVERCDSDLAKHDPAVSPVVLVTPREEDADAPAMVDRVRLPSSINGGAEFQPSAGIMTEITPSPQDTSGESIHKQEIRTSHTGDMPHRPTPLTLQSQMMKSDPLRSSDTSHPGSAASDYFSNASSPEIRDALAAQSFGRPVEVTSPTRLSRVEPVRMEPFTRSPTQRTEQVSQEALGEEGLPVSTSSAKQRGRRSSFALEPTIPEISSRRQQEALGPDENDGIAEMKRASIASIEVLPRNEVKSINIRRSGSYSSFPSTPSRYQDEDSGRCTPTSSLRPDPSTDASPECLPSGGSLSPMSSTANEEPSPSIRKTKVRREGLGSRRTTPSTLVIPKKSANRFTPDTAVRDPNATRMKSWQRRVSEPLTDDTNGPSKHLQLSSSTKSTEDQLEEKISSILTTIPARIRLTSGPDTDAPELPRPGTYSGSKRPDIRSPAMRGSQTLNQPPALTLAPAYAKSSPSHSSPGEPVIKLYHLHQAGKEVPIKLYVRLVGEYGERVMVRVGGGWADLGEYLKEYANHHGRRSVSDGRFEIKGLPQGHSSASVTTLSAISNGRTTPISRPGSTLDRPGSALSVQKPRFSGDSPGDFTIPNTPDIASSITQEVTPGSTESYSMSLRPSSRSSWTSEDAPLGLAGPKSRRVDVSPGKQAWVDGMMEKAKKASVEKKRPEESDFGNLGKVGGTKRVFMKSKEG
ncbi:MAG: hypothetical protein M1830_004996 [Pleopsidium flavum]|nr:MAG: hypothetical protein M1830_004996 [Pleopsidium flavum]